MTVNRRLTMLAALVGALAASPIAAAAARLPADLPWRAPSHTRRSRMPGGLGWRPAALWVRNPDNGMHWERGQLALPAGKGAHRRHDFKTAQKAARKAKRAKRRHAYERKHPDGTPQLFLGRQRYIDVLPQGAVVLVGSPEHTVGLIRSLENIEFDMDMVERMLPRLDP